ncbi:MAG: M48 family metallopeptidase [Desulfosporosinus sp.]|jgi:predicted metal-dependent hydrolase
MLILQNNNTIISYSIRKSHRAKHVIIRIGADGVQVVAPFFMNESDVISLVEKKRKWIFNKVEGYRQRQMQLPAEREFISGERLLFMGKSYPLKVLEHKGGSTTVNLTDGQFLVSINEAIPIEKRRDEIQRKLKQWYISRAKEIITKRLEFFANKMGVQYNTVRFKNQKTRWGSCSLKGNLNFNWKLVMAPEFIVDYVVVHELCHLEQMNHSPEFWLLVGTQISDYKKMRQWLKENGPKLNL